MDYETIKFIGFLNELAADSEYEFTPFSKVKDEEEGGIIYDDTIRSLRRYPVIADFQIARNRRTIISTWNDVYQEQGFVIEVVREDPDDWYVEVTSKVDPDFDIIIEDGRWYTV